MRQNIHTARRVAAFGGLIAFGLAGLKGSVGWLVGSPALLADALNSGTDVVARGAAWFGLRVAGRPPTERFPYGFYRAETLGALAVSGVITYAGGHLMWQSLTGFSSIPRLQMGAAGLAAAVVSMGVAYFLFRWESRTGEATGSQSLTATSEDARLDVLVSGAVLMALICSRYRVPYVEGLVTLAISGFVLWAGLSNAWEALLSLMDAQIDPELESEVAELIEDLPAVREVEKVRARKSGPFYFVDGHVKVRGTMDVQRAHALSHEAQRRVGERKPQVEGVILHIEPYHGATERVLVPVESGDDLSAQVSGHFGRAPFFLVATLEEGQITDVAVEPNDFRRREVRAGLAVIRNFVREWTLDAVIASEIGEISFHGLRDNFVDVYRSPAQTAQEALRDYLREELPLLGEPTHTSDTAVTEEGLEPKSPEEDSSEP